MLRGKVTNVTSAGVFVQTADFGTVGPCQAVSANYYVGDMVLLSNVGDDSAPDLVVVGKLAVGATTTGWKVAPGATVSESGGGWVTLDIPGNNLLIKSGAGTSFVVPYNVLSGTARFQMNQGLRVAATPATGGVEFGASGPTITAGAGAPSHTPPNGSIYLRTDGTASTTLYVRAGGAWTALS